MIKIGDKLYAETIPSDIVLVPNDLVVGKFVVSAGGQNVKSFNPGAKKIMITNGAGSAAAFSYNQPNKVVGINQNGELALFNRVPAFPPAGRVLLIESYGKSIPSAILTDTSIQLEGGWWYEVEILGAGGGGGSGIARDASVLPSNGTPGGNGGYYRGFFSLTVPALTRLRPGNAGGKGNGTTWAKIADVVTWQSGHNLGGDGGRSALLPVSPTPDPNDGLAPDNTGGANITKDGGDGIHGGANGGNSVVTYSGIDPSVIIGAGGSGAGADGRYGGNGGNSSYEECTTPNSCSGGAGGAGAGENLGGDTPSIPVLGKPYGYGGGAGGSGFSKPVNDFTLSGAGGGGGGASVFQFNSSTVICGGGGGGAGAGFGGQNTSTPGGDGLNSEDENVGGGASGGVGGASYRHALLVNGQEVSCVGANGRQGVIRIWRCV